MSITRTTLCACVFLMTRQSLVSADRIDEYMTEQMQRRGIPGAAIAVVEHGKLVKVGAYGLANVEHDAKMTSDSVFEIASMTKPITATAVMMLLEEGKISLADEIGTFVPDAPAEWRGITVRHLLTQTSGLAEMFPYQQDPMNPMDLTIEQMLASAVKAPIMFAPGTRAGYSDIGYFLLGMVIQKASGMDYGACLDQRVFAPTGMTSSRVQNQWEIIRHRVAPYMLRRGELLRGRRDWQVGLASHYGVLSTVTDLSKWIAALDAGKLVSQSGLAQMWTPATLNDGRTGEVYGDGYGFGWMVGDYRGRRIVEHGGFSGTHVLHFPEEHLSVVVLTNLDLRSGSDPRQLARGIAGLHHQSLAPPHTLRPSADPDPELTARLRSVLESAATGTASPHVTAGVRSFMADLPPFAREDLSRRLAHTETLAYIASDDATGRHLTRLDAPVARILYYSMQAGDEKRCYTFWLTADDKVAGFRSYRY